MSINPSLAIAATLRRTAQMLSAQGAQDIHEHLKWLEMVKANTTDDTAKQFIQRRIEKLTKQLEQAEKD